MMVGLLRPDQCILTHAHWYYWSMNIGIGIQALVMMCALLLVGSCTVHAQLIVLN